MAAELKKADGIDGRSNVGWGWLVRTKRKFEFGGITPTPGIIGIE